MLRKRRKPPVPPEDETQQLLGSLLEAPLAEEEALARPVALRSEKQQRQVAFRPFLLRNWVDYALQHTERILLLVLLAFAGYWLFDGYGRDWWYYRSQQATSPALASEPVPFRAPTAPAAAGPPPTVAADLVALPFTTPDMAESLPAPDFLAPQVMDAPATVEDLRPQRLRIPDLDVDTAVVEVFVVDGIWQVADYAAGYHHGTALPGEVGNMVMAGHAGLRGGVFRYLDRLAIGADILVEAGGWQYRYQVRERIRVWPTQVEVMNATPTSVLTLITCTAWDTQRLVVIADLVDARPLS